MKELFDYYTWVSIGLLFLLALLACCIYFVHIKHVTQDKLTKQTENLEENFYKIPD
jgi:uncharacterized membrane protein YukC